MVIFNIILFIINCFLAYVLYKRFIEYEQLINEVIDKHFNEIERNDRQYVKSVFTKYYKF